jgi:hypothetical protein
MGAGRLRAEGSKNKDARIRFTIQEKGEKFESVKGIALLRKRSVITSNGRITRIVQSLVRPRSHLEFRNKITRICLSQTLR